MDKMETDDLAPFHGPDSILSETIEQNLSNYMATNENFKPAIELLMDNYEGYPDMIRCLIQWANSYTDGEKNLEKAVEAVLLDHEQTIIPRLDEALATSESALPVISTLTASGRWNPVVSAMAARNKESTLHNLLTRETRLSKAGITHDVLASPKTFVDAICQQISEVIGNGKPVSESELCELYKRIATMSTYDETTTITALRLLNLLAREAPDPITRGLLRRISQEVRKEAVNVMSSTGIVPEHTARQYIIRLAVLSDCVANNVTMRGQVIDALLGLLAGDRGIRRRYEAEIQVLRGVYGVLLGDLSLGRDDEVIETGTELQCDVAEKIVLIRALCHFEVFEDILKSLFSYEHRTYIDGKPDEGKRKCLALLLAYAGVFIPIDELELSDMLSDDMTKQRLRQEVGTLVDEIENVVEICEDLKPGCPRFKIKGKPVGDLLKALENPLLARGILMWAREGLQGGRDTRALMVTAPRHLAFLEAIAQKHKVLQGDVLDIIRAAFMREYSELDINQQEELRSKFMNSVTGMIRIQMGVQIINVFLTSWADNPRVDRSHLRHFVTGLLKTISPPYSAEFAEHVRRLLENERVKSAVSSDTVVGKLVIEFKKELTASVAV